MVNNFFVRFWSARKHYMKILWKQLAGENNRFYSKMSSQYCKRQILKVLKIQSWLSTRGLPPRKFKGLQNGRIEALEFLTFHLKSKNLDSILWTSTNAVTIQCHFFLYKLTKTRLFVYQLIRFELTTPVTSEK